MEDNINIMETLLQRITEFSITSFELVKLKVVNKASDGISSFVTSTIIKATLACCMLFANLGLAFWIGDMLGKTYYGFLVVAGFYGFVAFILHFFMRKWLKRVLHDYFIRQMLN